MNPNEFLSKEIMNKNQEVGTVLSIDENFVVVNFPSGKKTYGTEFTFRQGYLSFVDDNLNALINQYFQNKDAVQKSRAQAREEKQAEFLAKSAQVNKEYKQLCKKNKNLKKWFGQDFVYPPLRKFEQENDFYIDKSIKYE